MRQALRRGRAKPSKGSVCRPSALTSDSPASIEAALAFSGSSKSVCAMCTTKRSRSAMLARVSLGEPSGLRPIDSISSGGSLLTAVK